GIEFAAEIAFGVGHARDLAIEAVEDYSEADGFGGVVVMPWLGSRPLNGVIEGVVAQGHVQSREDRWQQVDALAETAVARAIVGTAKRRPIHGRTPCSRGTAAGWLRSAATGARARILEPPATCWPIFTCTEAAGSKM